MNLIRKLKISKFTSIHFTSEEKEIIEFINSKLNDLIPFQMNQYPDSIFYMSREGKYILQHYINDRMWVRWYDFWEILETKYSIEYSNIQNLLKYMIEQSFKEKLLNLPTSIVFNNHIVEKAFITNVFEETYRIGNEVEKAFKSNKPTGKNGHFQLRIEQVYRNNDTFFSDVESYFPSIKK